MELYLHLLIEILVRSSTMKINGNKHFNFNLVLNKSGAMCLVVSLKTLMEIGGECKSYGLWTFRFNKSVLGRFPLFQVGKS